MSNFIDSLKNINFPFLSSIELYCDLGTSNTRIAIKSKGIVLREETYLGYNTRIKEPIFFGKEAKLILGKTPDFVKIVKPVANGVIYDFDAEVYLLRNFLEKAVHLYFANNIFRPAIRAVTSVPSIATEIERKAVEEVLIKVGCSQVFLIEKPIVNAAGYGFNVFSHQPNLIIDLGGGLIEIAIVSGGGVVKEKTLKNAGEYMNKLIYNYIYLKYGVILGENTCNNLKTSLLNFKDEEISTTIRGKSLETGLPKSIRVKTSDIKESLLGNFNQIIDAVKELIEASPPEIVEEIYRKGIILTGGLSNIKGIDVFFASELKIDVTCPDNPSDTTINGLIQIGKKHENLVNLKL
jgi:rod shape-determining protein MreB